LSLSESNRESFMRTVDAAREEGNRLGAMMSKTGVKNEGLRHADY
jgi:hypothetical protein